MEAIHRSMYLGDKNDSGELKTHVKSIILV